MWHKYDSLVPHAQVSMGRFCASRTFPDLFNGSKSSRDKLAPLLLQPYEHSLAQVQ